MPFKPVFSGLVSASFVATMAHFKHTPEDDPVLTSKNQAKDFVSTSTAHGLKPIFEKDRNIIRRVLWAVLFLSSVTALGYMVYKAYVDVSGHPFNTVSSLNLSSPRAFPAVTICNLNAVDLTTLSERNGRLMDELLSGDGNPTVDNMTSVLKKTNEDIHGNDAVSKEGFLTYCEYGEETLSCDDIFHARFMMEKKCYTLQTQTLKKATRRTSLKVTINVNVAGYLSNVESAGISFFVHEPGQEPDMMLNRYEAATGFTTSAGIRMYEYDYLPEPYKAFGDSTCTDTESEEFLSQGDSSLFYGWDNQIRYSLDCCLNTRARVKAEGICNCSVGDCGMHRIKGCMKNTIADILDEALASDFLGCPRPCHSHDYMVTMSTSYFPSAAALFHLKRNDRVRGNISHIRTNYLQLQIYFVDLIVRKTEHVAKYEWTTVMGLLGGNMGFFLGASVLTLAELLDFIVCLLLLCCEKLCRPRVLTRRTSSVQMFQAPLPPKGAL